MLAYLDRTPPLGDVLCFPERVALKNTDRIRQDENGAFHRGVTRTVRALCPEAFFQIPKGVVGSHARLLSRLAVVLGDGCFAQGRISMALGQNGDPAKEQGYRNDPVEWGSLRQQRKFGQRVVLG
jgi:hypothetical protein